MAEAMLSAFAELMSGTHLIYLFGGVCLGLVVGIIPGLGGIAGMSLLLPFIFGMDQVSALALLIGLVAVIPTSDTFTSVLMGVPGSSGSQATVLDGFPLAKRGEAARALGAAFSASLIGGLLGALVLSLSIVIARPIILAFGSAELFMLTVLGLSMVGVLAGRSLAKGLVSCGLGLMLGAIGSAPATGEFRMVFEVWYLGDGVPLVVVGLAVFAIPEIIDLLRYRGAISQTAELGRGWIDGMRDTIRHKWIVLRCALLGSWVGFLPGLGGSVVDWIAYGHIVQTTKDRENFGKGDIRGVIAPESANNAKEGGGLIPTLLFGIPGSGAMAVFLGGLVLIGLEPGVRMVTSQLDITYTIIWSLALANVLGAGLCLLLAKPVAQLTTIRYAYLAPFMITLICFAAFQASKQWGDIVTLFAIGLVGVLMKRFDYPRPAFLIGFVLAGNLETYLYQAIQFYGWGWLSRPGVIIIGILTVACIYLGVKFTPSRKGHPPINAARWPQLAFTGFALAVFLVGLADATTRTFLGAIYPMGVAVLMIPLTLFVLTRQMWGAPDGPEVYDQEAIHREQVASGKETAQGPALTYILWLAGLLVGAWLVGFLLALVAFVFAFLLVEGRMRVPAALLCTAAIALFLTGMAHLFILDFPAGLLQEMVRLPWPIG